MCGITGIVFAKPLTRFFVPFLWSDINFKNQMVRSCKIKSIMVHNKKKIGSPWNRIKSFVSTLVKKCLCNIAALMNEWYARISTTVLLTIQDLCVTFAYFKETDRSRRLNHLYFRRLLLSFARCKKRYKTNFVLQLLSTWWLTIAKSLCLNLLYFINAYVWFFVITSLTLCAIIVDPWGPLTAYPSLGNPAYSQNQNKC